LTLSARPRVEVGPKYVSSYGVAAVEVARLGGLILDRWQCDSLELMLSVRADGKWACFEFAEIVSRQNGKGSILEARVLVGLLILGEQLIMWSAHEYKTAMEAFRRVRTLLWAMGEKLGDNLVEVDGIQIKISNTNGEESFERLDTGARIKFIARSKGSGRGFSGDCNIVDETFAYTDDQHSALMPTMSARPNPQIIYTSSPPLTGDTGEILFRLRARAEKGNSTRLGYRDWGLEGTANELKEIDIDSRELWARSNPAYKIRIVEEFVQSERESMSDEKFAIERLGLWPKELSGGNAIDPADWLATLDATSSFVGDIAIGVDISPKRDYAAVAIWGLREDGLGHGQIVTYKPGVDWLLGSALEWRTAKNPVGVGMGRTTHASLEAELEKADVRRPDKADEPCYGDLAVLNATEMTAATGQILDAIKYATFRQIGQRELDASVAGSKTKETNEATVLVRKDLDSDTSPLAALMIARYVYETRAHLVQNANYDVLDSVF
jgi:hypothetical protein